MRFFKEELNKHYIHDVTSKDLGEYNTGLKDWCQSRGKPIKKSTQKSYKKVVKAFWNSMNLHYDLDLNTQKIDLVIYSSGKPDPLAYTRQIHIPPVLLDHVDKLNVKTPVDGPNRQELTYFERRTGLAKEELSTLSEHNLYPNKDNFNCLTLMNKPDCPVTKQIGLELKTKRRKREIPLDARCIKFINDQLKRHANSKIYGQTIVQENTKYIPYRFLFPIYRDGKWLRCDNFLLGIRALLVKANSDFNLGFTDRYTLHDFRRTLNGEMGDSGMSSEERAIILGHSKEVNETNYTNYKKMQKLMAQKASSSFAKFLKRQDRKN